MFDNSITTTVFYPYMSLTMWIRRLEMLAAYYNAGTYLTFGSPTAVDLRVDGVTKTDFSGIDISPVMSIRAWISACRKLKLRYGAHAEFTPKASLVPSFPYMGGDTAPTLDFNKILKFGDSIDEYEVDTGPFEVNRQTGLIMRNMGYGEVGAALALNPMDTFDNYNDVSVTGPVFNSNTPKYYSGMCFGYAGATVGQLLTLVSLAADYAYNNGIGKIIIGGGTNSVGSGGWTAQTQADHLAIIDTFIDKNPLFKIGVTSIRPISQSRTTGSGMAADTNRSVANMAAANVQLRANIALRASAGVTEINVADALLAMGTSGLIPDTYFAGDGLHLSARGAGVSCLPVKAWMEANGSAGNVLTARRIATLFTANLENFNGSDTAINVAAGGANNTGTITGTVPSPGSAAKSGNMNSNVVMSAPAHPSNGGKMLRAAITTVSGNASESLIFRASAFNTLATNGWANLWGEFYAIITVDDPNSILTTGVLNVLERSNTSNNYTQRTISLYRGGQAQSRTYYVLTPPLKGAATTTGHQASFVASFNPAIAGTVTITIEYWTGQHRTTPLGAT